MFIWLLFFLRLEHLQISVARLSLLCRSLFGYISPSVSFVTESKSVVLDLVKPQLLLEPVLGWWRLEESGQSKPGHHSLPRNNHPHSHHLIINETVLQHQDYYCNHLGTDDDGSHLLDLINMSLLILCTTLHDTGPTLLFRASLRPHGNQHLTAIAVDVFSLWRVVLTVT